MKRIFSWNIVLGAALILLSAFVYWLHFLIFRDAHHIFIYLIGDIAFVFIEVLMVTLGLHQLMQQREKKLKLNKMNMVIGAFFSEVGMELIRRMVIFDKNVQAVAQELCVDRKWTKRDFDHAAAGIQAHDYHICCHQEDLEQLKAFFEQKHGFLLNLLENPNLLEHESFTDLLWSTFHLNEELHYRKDFSSLPEADHHHLEGDAARMCRFLVLEWLKNIQHLQGNYPYLFSLAVRLNPFNDNAQVCVTN